ncbi:MAG: hypothetical protein CL484_09140 [Acidobacteria bacterium]|nr:hypothetical protein [Acidobacteriota bacterium]|tara:strand:+ start:2372 stop:2668 length:297 start_codon:yes stop_codon:yes gene_type:complete
MSEHAHTKKSGPEEYGFVCSCLHMTESDLLAKLDGTNIRTIRDLRRLTGAGDGCTACHQTLKGLLKARERTAAPLPTPKAGKSMAENTSSQEACNANG